MWAGVIYASAFVFPSKPHIFCSLTTFLKAQTNSASRSTDYLLWFACRGFHLFAFSILSLLLLNAFSIFKRWPIAIFAPTLAFGLFEQVLRNNRWPSINQTSLLLIDSVGIAFGMWFFVRHHIANEVRLIVPAEG